MKLFLTVAVIALSATAAFAADFSTPITDAEGKIAPSCPDKTPSCEKPLTLGSVAASALFATYPDETDPRSGRTISADDKVKRAALALKIYDARDVDLTSDETSLVKNLIAKAWPPLVVYRAWAILDPASLKR